MALCSDSHGLVILKLQLASSQFIVLPSFRGAIQGPIGYGHQAPGPWSPQHLHLHHTHALAHPLSGALKGKDAYNERKMSNTYAFTSLLSITAGCIQYFYQSTSGIHPLSANHTLNLCLFRSQNQLGTDDNAGIWTFISLYLIIIMLHAMVCQYKWTNHRTYNNIYNEELIGQSTETRELQSSYYYTKKL